MKLSEIVVSEAIVPDLESTERDAVIEELVDALVAAGCATKKQRDDLVKQILAREKNGSTGFGKGVAVPHVKDESIKKIACAIGVSQKGIEFNALDGQPVFSVVLLLSPASDPEGHLQAMEMIFTNLQKDQFRRFLRQAGSVEEVTDLLDEADTQQLQG